MANYKFDLDIIDGEEGEALVREILQGEGKIEVKRDFIVSNTGNVAVEYHSRGNPSGIAVTEADWWAFVLDGERYKSEVVILVRTARLKQLCRPYLGTKKDVPGGDDNTSRMILLNVAELVSA